MGRGGRPPDPGLTLATRGDEDFGNWIVVTGVGGTVPPAVINEALAAAPPEVRQGGVVLLRSRPIEEECLICGQRGRLSREHVPPRSSGNSARVTTHSLSDWLARDSLDDLPGGRFEQGGIWGYTLCADCNTKTGRYSNEYRRWAGTAARLLQGGLPESIEELDESPATKSLVMRLPNAAPGAFVRQVLSMMCSVAGPWKVVDQHPELREALLEAQTCALPSGLRLGMALCAGPSGMTAGPSLKVNAPRGLWAWVAVVAHPPLVFELELAGSPDRPISPMCEIGNFLDVTPETRGSVDLDVIVAFTHTAFPGDWRTRYQIEHRLGLDGLPEEESAW